MVQIKVTNWDKYNPKRDQSTYSWLRLNNDIALDQGLFGLNSGQKYAWILILCECSRSNKDSLDLNLGWLSHLSGVPEVELDKLIQHLEGRGMITTAGDRARPQTTPTNERTNERKISANKETPGEPASPIPLVDLWNEHCGDLPKVARATAKRRQVAKARWPEHPEADWIKIIQTCASNPFLSGKNDRGWRASFDFILKPDRAQKILEGAYGTSSGGAAVINLNRSWS